MIFKLVLRADVYNRAQSFGGSVMYIYQLDWLHWFADKWICTKYFIVLDKSGILLCLSKSGILLCANKFWTSAMKPLEVNLADHLQVLPSTRWRREWTKYWSIRYDWGEGWSDTHKTSSQKLGRCASRRIRSIWKSLGRVRFWSKMFRLKILAYLHSCILSY